MTPAQHKRISLRSALVKQYTPLYMQKIMQVEPDVAASMLPSEVKAHATLMAWRLSGMKGKYTLDNLPYDIRLKDEMVLRL